MIKRTPLCLSVFILILVLSCEYEPNGEYQRPVDSQAELPQLNVIELNMDEDTLCLYADEIIYFHFTSDRHDIRSVRMLIDSTDMGQLFTNEGSFEIRIHNFEEGLHDLKLEIYTSSGTNSIADRVGFEGFKLEKTWALNIDRSYIPGLVSEIRDGFLQIHWNEYAASNFLHYEISKDNQEIKRIVKSTFTDSTYVGERAYYRIVVKTSDGKTTEIGAFFMNDDLPELNFSVEESNTYILRWDKTKYYQALKSYQIFQRNGNTGFEEVGLIEDPDSTSYVLQSGLFGDEISFELRVTPKEGNVSFIPSNYSYFKTGTSGKLGYTIPGSESYNFGKIGNNEFISVDNCRSLFRYSLTQREITQEISYESTGCSTCDMLSLRTSPSGTYLTAAVDCDRDIMFSKGKSLSDYTIHKLQEITNGVHYYSPISDAGTGLVSSSSGGFYVYDFKNALPLACYDEDYTSSDSRKLKISSSGEYIFVFGDSLRLLQYNNTRFTTIWKTSNPNTYRFYGFDRSSRDRHALWDGSIFSVKRNADLAIIYEFELSAEYLLDIDYANEEILLFNPGHLYIRSYKDGTLLKDIPTNISPTNFGTTCFLMDHRIVYTKGLMYEVN